MPRVQLGACGAVVFVFTYVCFFTDTPVLKLQWIVSPLQSIQISQQPLALIDLWLATAAAAATHRRHEY